MLAGLQVFLTKLRLLSGSHRLRIEGGMTIYMRCDSAPASLAALPVQCALPVLCPPPTPLIARAAADTDINLPEVKEPVRPASLQPPCRALPVRPEVICTLLGCIVFY